MLNHLRPQMGILGREEVQLQAELQSLRRDRDMLTEMLAKSRVETQVCRDMVHTMS